MHSFILPSHSGGGSCGNWPSIILANSPQKTELAGESSISPERLYSMSLATEVQSRSIFFIRFPGRMSPVVFYGFYLVRTSLALAKHKEIMICS